MMSYNGNRLWRFLPVMLAAILMSSPVAANPLKLLLSVEEAEVAWADSRIYEKLEALLVTDLGLEVQNADREGQVPVFPRNRNNTDSIINWAQEVGGRYLLVVTIDSERLERKKTFSLPLIFHKYETVGIVDGEMRLYDVARGRLLMTRQIDLEMEAKRVFQANSDGNRNDPTIHLTATEKLAFFGKLEGKLAKRLAKRVKKTLRKG